MPVKVLPRPPPAEVDKPTMSHGHEDNNYTDRYHDDREQGELVDNRIYVGGLGYRIEERDLFYFFETFGPVQHAGIITDGGYSKGYGFVTFHCKEVVKRLLDTEEGEGLVLKGRSLYVGAARQRHGQAQYYGRGRGQGLRRHDNGQGENSPGKESAENPKAEPVNPSQSINHQPASYDPHLDPGLCYPYDPLAQLPFYPELSYPIYYPQYPAYPTPTPDVAWYASTQYQDMTMVPQDAYTAQVYPVSYSSSPEGNNYLYPIVIPVDNQFPSSVPYWPDQSTMYPIIYNCSQPALQYSSTGEISQPVPGYLEPAPALQDASATQDHPQEYQHINYPSGYSEDPHQLGDSGFQDSSSSFLDTTGCQDQLDEQGKQAGHGQGHVSQHQGGQGQDVHPQREMDPSQRNKSSKPTNPPRFSQQKSSANSNQGHQNYTKLKNSGNDRNVTYDNRGFNNSGGSRDSRVYPSPYKSFSPFTGNLPTRQFPFPPGPRPYFPGQGRGGRGRIWGNNSGGRQGVGPGWAISKRKQGKKGPGNENKAGIMEDVKVPTGLSGNQPDILQGPMEKLEIK